jgi:hypothetical protein
MVVTSADGNESEQLIDPRTVDISNATDNEMLALNAYLVEIGKLDSSVYTSSVLSGTSVSKVDLSSASNLKNNFLNNLNDVMIMQYNAHNLDGYAQCRNILGVYNSFMGMA